MKFAKKLHERQNPAWAGHYVDYKAVKKHIKRVFPPCALISHAQGSSGVVDNMPFAWRGHTKSLTTRARPSPDLAVWLE